MSNYSHDSNRYNSHKNKHKDIHPYHFQQSGMGSQRDIWIKFTGPMLAVLVVVVCAIVYLEKRKRNLSRRLQLANNSNSNNSDKDNEEDPILPVRIARMTLQERFLYFDYLFRQSGNQFELSEDQIIASKPQTTTHETDLDIEEGQPLTTMNHNDDHCNYQDTDDFDSERTIHLSLNKHNDNLNDNHNDNDNETTQILVEAECVICFEEYEAGDVLVRSETCNHVYHRDCYLSYLAKQKRSKKQLHRLQQQHDTTNWNPECPICRQTFCTLIEPPATKTSSTTTATIPIASQQRSYNPIETGKSQVIDDTNSSVSSTDDEQGDNAV